MNAFFMELRSNKRLAFEIVLLIGVSIFLRLAGLGYSNFQGDEIDALCRFSNYKTPGQFLVYLLGQRKGPGQFLITCVYNLIDPKFSSEFATRLPFAIANLLALACFFLLVYRLFTLQTAVYASFLFAVNGIFIAFARIVQYQSFVILGGVAGILCLVLALQHDRWRLTGLYLGLTLAALGLLTHFDAAFFLPPMAMLVLAWWLKFHNQPDFARLRIHLIAAVALFTFLVLAFYVPYASHLGSYQLDNWQSRFNGDSTDIFRLFQFYNPGPVLWICLGFVIVGLTRLRLSALGWQVILAWLLPPLIFMSLIFKDSRTHAYTYILPLCIIAGIGIETLIDWLRPVLRGKSIQIAHAVVLAILLIFAYFSYGIFIDHYPEYPWSPKRVLGMELGGGYLTGTFGFPYSREWREIGKWFQNLPNHENDLSLATNEKDAIAEFYLPSTVVYQARYSREQFPGKIDAPHGIYILVVQGPQSWMDQLWGLSPDGWHEKFTPVRDFVNQDGQIVASAYFLTDDQIKASFP